VRVVSVETPRASPFAASLLFDYVGSYMYEGDAPLAERRAQALALDRELLAELLGADELRELLDPAAVAEVELELQSLGGGRRPHTVDGVHDLLRRLGDLRADEVGARVTDGLDAAEALAALERDRRAVRVRVAGEDRWIAIEDTPRYRDGLGVSPPPGIADAWLDAAAGDPLDALLLRWARTHTPFTGADPSGRWGIAPSVVVDHLAGLVATDRLVEVGVSGEVVWLGHGSLGRDDGRVALYRRDRAALLASSGQAEGSELPGGEAHQRIRGHLSRRGASFFRELRGTVGEAARND